MPYANAVRYEVSDLIHTRFEDDSFEVITAISVIEHGFDRGRLLAEVSRLLRPGGYFIASFDYWPDKVDTEGINFFGMDWTIFSERDVRELLNKEAEVHNLTSRGKSQPRAGISQEQRAHKEYTFAWMVLQKSTIVYRAPEPVDHVDL